MEKWGSSDSNQDLWGAPVAAKDSVLIKIVEWH